MKTIILLTLLIFKTASAGVSSVGNGGGFAEMQFYSLDVALNQFLTDCSKNSECQEVLKYTRFPEINKGCDIPYFHKGSSSWSLDSCFLYQQSEIPKGQTDLIVLVLKLKILNALKLETLVFDGYAADLQNILQKNFTEQLQWKVKSYPFFPNSEFLYLRVINRKVNTNSKAHIFIETNAKSYEITDYVQKKLSCQNLESIEFSQLKIDFQNLREIHFQSDVKVVCKSDKKRRRMFLNLSLSQNETLNTDIVVIDQE